MAKKPQITLSEVGKKHVKVVGYLMISAGLAYVLSALTGKPEAVYLTPVINYLIYIIKMEVLDKEGVVEALKK